MITEWISNLPVSELSPLFTIIGASHSVLNECYRLKDSLEYLCLQLILTSRASVYIKIGGVIISEKKQTQKRWCAHSRASFRFSFKFLFITSWRRNEEMKNVWNWPCWFLIICHCYIRNTSRFFFFDGHFISHPICIILTYL